GRRLEEARAARAKLAPEKRRAELQKQWTILLGIELLHDPKVETVEEGKWRERYPWKAQIIRHPGDPHLAVPLVCLLPRDARAQTPVVIAVAQGGKKGFFQHRAEAIVRLLDAGVAVCLPDLRG